MTHYPEFNAKNNLKKKQKKNNNNFEAQILSIVYLKTVCDYFSRNIFFRWILIYLYSFRKH